MGRPYIFAEATYKTACNNITCIIDTNRNVYASMPHGVSLPFEHMFIYISNLFDLIRMDNNGNELSQLDKARLVIAAMKYHNGERRSVAENGLLQKAFYDFFDDTYKKRVAAKEHMPVLRNSDVNYSVWRTHFVTALSADGYKSWENSRVRSFQNWLHDRHLYVQWLNRVFYEQAKTEYPQVSQYGLSLEERYHAKPLPDWCCDEECSMGSDNGDSELEAENKVLKAKVNALEQVLAVQNQTIAKINDALGHNDAMSNIGFPKN